MDIKVAPTDIFNVVRCKCRIDTHGPCTSMLCSCRKHGLKCVAACKNCNGEVCENLDMLSCNEFDDVDYCESESEVEEDNIKIIVDDFMEFDMPWVVEEIIE